MRAARRTGKPGPLRLFAASLATETNTFSPIPTDRRAFEAAFYAPPGAHPATPTLCSAPVVAAREAAAAGGHTLMEGTSAWAEPAGLVSRAAHGSLRDEILAQLRAALPLDVALFGLHGCMVADGCDDCEGDLLARAREVVGPGCVVGAEIDLHAHLTDLMVDSADLVVAFKEFPHTDFLARARDLVRLCLAAARGGVAPIAAVWDARHIGGYMTSSEPGRSFTDRLLALEGRGGILSASVVHGFQAADVADVGTKVLVYADGDRARAAALAERLGREVLSWGAGATPRHYAPEEAVAHARAAPRGPVVMADRWDNPGGGVAGDSTVMLRALLAAPDLPAALGALWDPVAVSFCLAAGAGAVLPMRIGGKATPMSGDPVDVLARVEAVSDELVIPFEGSRVSLGAAARVSVGSLDLVLATGRAQTFSPVAFTALGVDLGAKRAVVVKSSNHFHAAFAPLAAEVIYLDCGGPYPPDPRRIPYTKLRRPISPLDSNPWLPTA